MRQAISTHYNVSPATGAGRMRAITGSGIRLAAPYDHGLSQEANHRAAAEALARKLGWTWGNHWAGGGVRDGYVFVDSTDGLP
jgi:hypothetical protein